ncbi:hypothetical protein DSECCO2_469590 [anaerobic digester metagenome]
MNVREDDPLFGLTQAFSLRFGNSTLAQEFDGSVHVAIGLHQSFTAFHHAYSGSLAQFFYHGCGNLCHLILLCVLRNRGLRVRAGWDIRHAIRFFTIAQWQPIRLPRLLLLQRFPRSLLLRLQKRLRHFRHLRKPSLCLPIQHWP